MGRSEPLVHKCQVIGSPVPGVFSTRLVSGVHFSRHWHDGYGIGLVRQGGHLSASGRGQVEALAGDVITHHPGEVHDGRPAGGALRSWEMLQLESGAFADAIDGDTGAVHLPPPVVRDARVARALHEVFELLAAWAREQSVLRAAHLGLEIEAGIVRSCQLLMRGVADQPMPRRTISPGIRRVHDWLSAAREQPPSLADLAREAGLSRFQVLRHFEQAYGLPPHAWLLVRRAELARGLIRDGLALCEAASSAGFSDQSHMTRVFRRHFGYTPGDWQRVARG